MLKSGVYKGESSLTSMRVMLARSRGFKGEEKAASKSKA